MGHTKHARITPPHWPLAKLAAQAFLLGLLCCLVLPLIAEAQQRSIINPGFEEPLTPPSSLPGPNSYTSAPAADVPGWNTTDSLNQIEIWRSGFNSVPASSGSYFAELNANSAGFLYQDVCMTNGETLGWSFDHRRRDSGTETAQFVVRNAAGTADIQVLATQSSSNSTWNTNANSATYNGATGIQRVGFRAVGGSSNGNFLDNITIDFAVYAELNASATSVNEGETVGLPALVISGKLDADVTFPITIGAGSTASASDYTLNSTSITVPAGNYSGQEFTLPFDVTQDTEIEGSETVVLEIGTPTGPGAPEITVADIQCVGAPDTTVTHTILDKQTADLELDYTVNATSPQAGDTLTFTTTVTNTNAAGAPTQHTATNTTVAVNVPTGLTNVGSYSPSVGSISSGVWTIPSLAPGATATLTYTGDVNGAAGSTHSNFAEISASDAFDTDSTPNNFGTNPAEDDGEDTSFTVSSVSTDTSTPSLCLSQGGSLLGPNLFTVADNGTFGTGSGAADEIVGADPYPSVFGIYNYHNTLGFGGGTAPKVQVASNYQTRFFNGAGHTGVIDPENGAAGRFVLVDGSPDQADFFTETVGGLTPNTNYEFSMWFSNMLDADQTTNIDPNIGMTVDGVTGYASGPLAETSEVVWTRVGFVFNSGARTSATFAVKDQGGSASGNDFMIDNVTVRSCGLPTGTIQGVVYTDNNPQNNFPNSGEAKLGAIKVQLIDDQGDGDASNDIIVSEVDSAASTGAYSFINVPLSANYIVRVDDSDTDLPGTITGLGTPNDLAVSLTTDGQTVGDLDFGFDAHATALPPASTTLSSCVAPASGAYIDDYQAGWFGDVPSGTLTSDRYWNNPTDEPTSTIVNGAVGPDFANASSFSTGSGLATSFSGSTINFTGGDQATAAAAYGAGDYIAFSFTTAAGLANGRMANKFGFDLRSADADLLPFDIAVLISDDPTFATAVTATVDQTVADADIGSYGTYQFSSPVQLDPSTTYYVRVPVFNYGGTSGVQLMWADNFQIGTGLCADHPDAPDTYGASTHAQPQTSSVFMGAGLTTDVAGYNSATAAGDSDDGATIPTTMLPGATETISVDVTGASGLLSVWIDWNNNDVFDAGEQIITDLEDNGAADDDGAAGTIAFDVTPPATLVAGQSYARFRWTTDSGATAVSPASDGEVEDYAIMLAEPYEPVLPTQQCQMNISSWDLSGLTPKSENQYDFEADGGWIFNDNGEPQRGSAPDATSTVAEGGNAPSRSTAPASSGEGETHQIVQRIEGTPGTSLTLDFTQATPGADEQWYYIVKASDGSVLATSSPISEAQKANIALPDLTVTVPGDGVVYAHSYVADFQAAFSTPQVDHCATVTGQVFEDTDLSGTLDGGEPDIPAVTVGAYTAGADNTFGNADDVLVDTAVTASPYTLNIPPADYEIRVDAADADIPAGFQPTSPTTIPETLTAGASVVGENFGFAPVPPPNYTTNTVDGNACVASGGILSGSNLFTDLDGGSFGTGSGAADEIPQVNPYASEISGGNYKNSFGTFGQPGAFGYGDYSIISNHQGQRNQFQHGSGIYDPVNGYTGRFFISDPDSSAPTFSVTLGSLVSGASYEVSFWVADSELNPAGDKNRIGIFSEGVEVYNTGFVASGSPMEWKKYSFVATYVGNAPSIDIEIKALETGANGRDFFFDEINVIECDLPISDRGDAPATYGDASQFTSPNLYIGAGEPDVDLTAQPSADADADDDATAPAIDDEELSAPAGAAGSTTYAVTVPVLNNTGADAFMCGYVDAGNAAGEAFNGTFNAANERACSTVPANAALQNVTLNWTTLDFAAGNVSSFLRLRLSALQTEAEAATGNATSIGEIEDYKITVNQLDYSDAPATFGDATHTIIAGIQLGAAIDPDPASLAGPNANNDGADDDGVTLPASFPVDSTVSIPVAVTGSGALQAWIDWNGNGVFDNPAEQIANDVQDTDNDGVITLEVDVPADAVTGASFARFRWSSDFTIGATGAAPDGEVEDYQISITQPFIRVTGTVWLDIGIGGGTAHDGVIDGDEAGVAGVTVEVVNGTGTLIDTAVTDVDGAYELRLPTGGQHTFRAIAPDGTVHISQPSYPPQVTSTPGTTSFLVFGVPLIENINFGLAKAPRLTQDQSKTGAPGSAVTFPHIFTSETAMEVTFALQNEVASTPGIFSTSIFEDTDCDGAIGAGEAAIANPYSVEAGDQVCLIVRASIAAGTSSGQTLTYDLAANATYTGTSVTALETNSDTLTVSEAGSLVLTKQVCNVTTSVPACNAATGAGFTLANQGAPGDVIAYRITFTNPGPASVDDVFVVDTTPPFSALTATLPSVIASPAGLTCALDNTPGAGGSGTVKWLCAGAMSPGSEGAVSFEVVVDQ